MHLNFCSAARRLSLTPSFSWGLCARETNPNRFSGLWLKDTRLRCAAPLITEAWRLTEIPGIN